MDIEGIPATVRSFLIMFGVGRRVLLTCLAASALLLSGCAQRFQMPMLPSGALSDCESLFLQVDEAVNRARVQDHGPVRIAGFPYLRIDRFSASFRETVSGSVQLQTWVGHMAGLDAEARDLEVRNLGQPVAGLNGQGLITHLDSCRSQLADNLLRDPVQLDQLRREAVVPDDYVTSWRVIGLYPFTSGVVLDRILAGHEEMRGIFSLPLSRLPIKGRIIRWHEAKESHPMPESPVLPHDALGIPRPSAATLQHLFRLHAPIWEVDVVDDNDLIGTPVWHQGPKVDTGQATEFQQLSYTRFNGQILLQLNYIIWFKARPGDDIYAGNFDGLTWRVTLSPSGEPLLYDSIHNCGCYLSYFPTDALSLRRDLPQEYFEPPLVLQPAPSEPLVIRLGHGSHFIERVYTDTGGSGSRPLAASPYDRLRSLPTATGYHSLFGRFGLVPGSERPERFILWPMGVRSPGAMRQWGHHAVAFVGRRHFDDPWLIQSLFQMTP
jgi:hypothetical protein